MEGKIIQIIYFFVLVIGSVSFFAYNVRTIRRNILLGLDEDFSDQPEKRWRNLLLIAFGQKKMFRNPLVAILHLMIYVGFVIINIEVLEIFLDGVFGTHRLFAKPLGSVYTWLINGFEFLGVLVLISCIAFLGRRNVVRLKRFISHDLDGW